MQKTPAYHVSKLITVLLTLLAVLTVWPMHASKVNDLGYMSHCTWVPWSTLILLGLAGFSCVIRKRVILNMNTQK